MRGIIDIRTEVEDKFPSLYYKVVWVKSVPETYEHIYITYPHSVCSTFDLEKESEYPSVVPGGVWLLLLPAD